MALVGFMDESIRKRYCICVVVVRAEHRGELSRLLRAELDPGQRRLHAYKESDAKRRRVIGALNSWGRAEIWIYDAPRPSIVARPRCLEAIVPDLTDAGADQLLIERGDPGQDDRDRQTLFRIVAKLGSDIRYAHIEPHTEPGLWAADLIAWAYTAGGVWRRQLGTGACVRMLEL